MMKFHPWVVQVQYKLQVLVIVLTIRNLMYKDEIQPKEAKIYLLGMSSKAGHYILYTIQHHLPESHS